ncbi:MAG: 23S rRNA (uracil(1939)-C(5))-methyltransferase RlmD [Bacteroidota bacterium]
MARVRKLKKTFHAEVELVDMATDGRSVAKHEDRVIFVEGGVPGDTVEVFVFGRQKGVLAGRVVKLIKPSPKREQAVCEHFGYCGGCKWQNVKYEGQMGYKEQHVLNSLTRIGKVEAKEYLPILGSKHIYNYRNKVEFSFSTSGWRTPEQMEAGIEFPKEGVLGYHAPKFFDKVIPIDQCHLPPNEVNAIRNEVGKLALENAYPFYNIRSHEGWLRTLGFRTSVANGELMVILVVAEEKKEWIETIFQHLETKFPEITHLVWIVNPKMNSVYSDQPYHLWKGSPYLTESLGKYQFHIRPLSFFQTNPRQATELYGVVEKYLKASLSEENEKHNIVYDLYSGTGSIGIFVSDHVNKVIGIEYVQSAVDDAWDNIRLNELDESRFSFYAGDMKKILTSELVEKEGQPDVIIADPPRQGMDPKVVKQILKVSPAYIIYVSCKPATQARDLEMMKGDYDLLSVQPVDMFPHTAHVENVVWMKRKENPASLQESGE